MSRKAYVLPVVAAALGGFIFALHNSHPKDHLPVSGRQLHFQGSTIPAEKQEFAKDPLVPSEIPRHSNSSESPSSLEEELREVLSFTGKVPFQEIRRLKRKRELSIPILYRIFESSNDNVLRAAALSLLAVLRAPQAIPILIKQAGVETEEFRVAALLDLQGFDDSVSFEKIFPLYSAGKGDAEKAHLIRIIGNCADSGAYPLLRQIEAAGGELGDEARRSILKIQSSNSDKMESDLVRYLRGDDPYLRTWAARRIQAKAYPASASYLREAFEAQRSLPWLSRDGVYEFFLLEGVGILGGSLSDRERSFLDGFDHRRCDPIE